MGLSNQPKSDEWDILIIHFLGVDHAGHWFGPDHPAMHTKLVQMNDVVASLIKAVDEDTLLIVMGDHGMDSKGDHGGESQGEIESALFLYSQKPFFAHSSAFQTVRQIDLVPTLALLLGVPIPFNNLGTPIPKLSWDLKATIGTIFLQ